MSPPGSPRSAWSPISCSCFEASLLNRQNVGVESLLARLQLDGRVRELLGDPAAKAFPVLVRRLHSGVNRHRPSLAGIDPLEDRLRHRLRVALRRRVHRRAAADHRVDPEAFEDAPKAITAGYRYQGQVFGAGRTADTLALQPVVLCGHVVDL